MAFRPPAPPLRLTLVLLLLLSATIATAQSSDQSIVDANYPAELIADFAKFATPQMTLDQSGNFVAGDLDGTGQTNYLVAGYTNGRKGAVRVIRKSGNNATVVAAPDFPGMGGHFIAVELIDLDADRRPEVIVQCSGMRAATHWIFKWSAGQLNVFGPSETVNGVIAPTTVNADYVDLDGDGVLEVVGYPTLSPRREDGTLESPGPVEVFSVKNGTFTKSESPVLWYGEFARGKGEPVTEKQTFPARLSPGRYELRVNSGDPQARNVVTAGEVHFNGQLVLGNNDFKNKKRELAVVVTPGDVNTVEVRLTSAPGTSLRVQVVKAN